jgi:hypothetical protein
MSSSDNEYDPVLNPLPEVNDEKPHQISELRVLDIKGRTYKFAYPSSGCTILQLKSIIEKESGVEVRLQRLIYGGRQLTDDSTLETAGVKPDTVLHLFVRPDNIPTAIATPAAGSTAATAEAILVVDGVRHGGAVGINMPAQLADDEELQEFRRRVRLLATLLLVVSGLNVFTLTIYLFDALFEALKPDEWVMWLLQLAANSLGVVVGLLGIKGTATMDEANVQQYCFGLLVVGFLYISVDCFGVAEALQVARKAEPTSGTTTTTTTPSTTDPTAAVATSSSSTDQSDVVNAAVTSLFFTVAIWLVCFYRAFQFRYRLHAAMS